MIASGAGSNASNTGTRRGAPAPFVDNEAVAAASATGAPVVLPKTKISDIGGMRFNVKVHEQRMVAILNEEGLILVDPSAATGKSMGGTQSMACQRFPWPEVLSATAGEKTVVLRTANGASTELHTPDARSMQDEINRQAGLTIAADPAGATIDKVFFVFCRLSFFNGLFFLQVAQTIATAARLAITHKEIKCELYGVLDHNMHGIKSRDFAPGCFALLRERFNVSDQVFVDEWTSDRLARVQRTPGLKTTRTVVPSKTGLLVALELSSSEASSLHDAMKNYWTHITKHAPFSLLPRFVGLFSADSTQFVVFINAVAPQSPVAFTTYDLNPANNRIAPPAARGKAHSHLLDKVCSFLFLFCFVSQSFSKRIFFWIIGPCLRRFARRRLFCCSSPKMRPSW